MNAVSLLLFAFLLIGTQPAPAQIMGQEENTPMDTQSLISVLNFSKTLIQDAEITFLWYINSPTHPEDAGKRLQQFIEHRKQEYRDAPQKTSRPEALRKKILRDIERAETYGSFGDQRFLFKEVNLVFQRLPDSREKHPQFNYRMEQIACFDTYPSSAPAPFPSVEYARYYAGGRHEYYVVNPRQNLDGVLPNQFDNYRSIGVVEEHPREDEDFWMISFPFRIPPGNLSSDTAKVQVESSEVEGEAVFILTHSSVDKILTKTYVRLSEVPQVFREEHYFKSESPTANEDGYCLRLVQEYSDFAYLEPLGIAHPKVFESKEYRADGFMRRTARITILEMEFNQGLPVGFFEWNLQEYCNTAKESATP